MSHLAHLLSSSLSRVVSRGSGRGLGLLSGSDQLPFVGRSCEFILLKCSLRSHARHTQSMTRLRSPSPCGVSGCFGLMELC